MSNGSGDFLEMAASTRKHCRKVIGPQTGHWLAAETTQRYSRYGVFSNLRTAGGLTTNAPPNGSAWESPPPNRLRFEFRDAADRREEEWLVRLEASSGLGASLVLVLFSGWVFPCQRMTGQVQEEERDRITQSAISRPPEPTAETILRSTTYSSAVKRCISG